MERYDNKSESGKAMVDIPWAFTLSRDFTSRLSSLEALIKERIIRTPVQKRTLFIMSPYCKAQGTFDNLCCINQDEWDDADSDSIGNPAVSIGSSPQRIIDHIRRNDFDLDTFGRIMIFDIGLEEAQQSIFINDISFILDKVRNRTIEVHLFTDQEQLPSIFSASAIRKDWKEPTERRTGNGTERNFSDKVPYKERISMQTKRNEKPEPVSMEDKIKGYMDEILAYPHPEELEEIKKLIKKNIPLGHRTYFAAYLLLKSGYNGRRSEGKPQRERTNRQDRRERTDRQDRPMRNDRPERAPRADRFEQGSRFEKGDRPRRTDRPERPERKQIVIPDSKNFYINVGSQDRMNPKALAAFVSENCGIQMEDVMAISVKSTYSFFTVKNDLADQIVPALIDKPIGKKTVKVNLAKSNRQQNGPKDSDDAAQNQVPAETEQLTETSAPAEAPVAEADGYSENTDQE